MEYGSERHLWVKSCGSFVTAETRVISWSLVFNDTWFRSKSEYIQVRIWCLLNSIQFNSVDDRLTNIKIANFPKPFIEWDSLNEAMREWWWNMETRSIFQSSDLDKSLSFHGTFYAFYNPNTDGVYAFCHTSKQWVLWKKQRKWKWTHLIFLLC